MRGEIRSARGGALRRIAGGGDQNLGAKIISPGTSFCVSTISLQNRGERGVGDVVGVGGCYCPNGIEIPRCAGVRDN